MRCHLRFPLYHPPAILTDAREVRGTESFHRPGIRNAAVNVPSTFQRQRRGELSSALHAPLRHAWTRRESTGHTGAWGACFYDELCSRLRGRLPSQVLWLAAKYAGQGGGHIRLQEFCAAWLDQLQGHPVLLVLTARSGTIKAPSLAGRGNRKQRCSVCFVQQHLRTAKEMLQAGGCF